jgi:Tfp pilus assembly protein PilE
MVKLGLTLRQSKGTTIIELSIVAGVLVIVSILCANLGVVSLASTVNDAACRDAARAAAQASDSASSLKLAQTVVLSHQTDGYFITQPTVDSSSFVYQDYSGSPPANTSPYVQVTTTSQVKVPGPLFFFGAQFEQSGVLTCSRTYRFPIVRTTLYLP